MSTRIVMGIVASLIGMGIAASVSQAVQSARAEGSVESRLAEHEKQLRELTRTQALLERLDERTADIVRRLERMEEGK